MKLQLGIAACLLAGCSMQPEARGHGVAKHSAGKLVAATAGKARAVTLAPITTTLRIGVEYLPPELDTADMDGARAAPEVDRTEVLRPERLKPVPTTLVERSKIPEGRHTWALSAEDLSSIDDPIERETLRFFDDLVREDRRRTEREVRLPFLDWQPADLDLSQRLWSEDAIAEAQRQWVDEHGMSVLARPMRKMLRRFPLVTELEVTIDDFRSSFVPMSAPYREAHTKHRSLGRLSVRLHASDLDDPVEIVYIRSGIRIGSSQDRAKLSIDWPLADNLALTLRTRRNYFTQESRLRADLSYRHSDTMSIRFALGDDMDFLSTSSSYSLFEAPMDGAPGLLMYAVHVF